MLADQAQINDHFDSEFGEVLKPILRRLGTPVNVVIDFLKIRKIGVLRAENY